MDTIIDLFEAVAALGLFIFTMIVIFGGMPRLFNMIVDRITLANLKRMAELRV